MSRTREVEEGRLSAKRGRPPIGKSPKKEDLLRLYVAKDKSIREVAADLGCSKDMVSRAIKSHKIDSRSNTKRSGLRKFGLKTLKEAVRKRGLRGTARDIGVNPSTLSRFLRSEIEK